MRNVLTYVAVKIKISIRYSHLKSWIVNLKNICFRGRGSFFWREDLVLQKGSFVPELENLEAGFLWLTNVMKDCFEYRNHVFTVLMFLTVPSILLYVSWAFGECGNYHFKALLFLITGELVALYRSVII